MALVGYARVSTDSQDLASQRDALTAAGCEKIFTEVISSTVTTRPQLVATMDYLRAGDVLVIVAVDRLSRNMLEFLTIVEELRAAGVEVRSLSQGFDTTTPEGRMVMAFYATFAQLERENISRRTRDGLAAARARGRVGGRPTVLTADRREAILHLKRADKSHLEIADALRISERSVSRAVADLFAIGALP